MWQPTPVILLRVCGRLFRTTLIGCGFSLLFLSIEAETPPVFGQVIAPLVQQYCIDCHGDKKVKGDINLQQLLTEPSMEQNFKTWEQVVDMLEFQDMPPEDESQPTEGERESLIASINNQLNRAIRKNAGDPGHIVLRRLTSAEYAYTIRDLTGLDLDFSQSFIGEAVGGEGFSNVGEVQFMQDATLERYLEAAKRVASHALIGAGPLQFYQDPGKTGQELSAINRIKDIYRRHGFRTGAGEGAKAYGLDQYAKAFYAAWRYRHRQVLDQESVTLTALAEEAHISPRFVKHIWQVVTDPSPTFPGNEIVSQWRSLPVPSSSKQVQEARIREACSDLYAKLLTWQKTLASSTRDDEEYAVLTEDPFAPNKAHAFKVRMNRAPDSAYTEFEIFVRAASGDGSVRPVVLWKQPRLEMREVGSNTSTFLPLRDIVSPETAGRLQFGKSFNGGPIDPTDFVTYGSTSLKIDIAIPSGTARAQFVAEANLDPARGDDCMVRCEITDGYNETETISSTGFASALLADPNSPRIEKWRTGILAFARNLPQVSHREATPSDRDHIPPPFDNTYNKPERNYFHTAIKYHRDDRFLSEKILDSDTVNQLDQAWTDLLTGFDYHDTIFRFICRKFQLENPVESIAQLEQEWIDGLASAIRLEVRKVFLDFHEKQVALEKARPGHLSEALQLAEQAWRRPLLTKDRNRLRSFYLGLMRNKGFSHEESIRALLTRILVAPEFLYRIESPSATDPMVPLSGYELASRLSYFLWSSKPDDELLGVAASGGLNQSETLAQQTRRMLRDPKARRFATEFFGQWFGFYRFNDFSGIDTGHFSEFSEALKSSMYDEAISFFEHIVRQDRPVDDILFADYTFLDQNLARHYHVPWEPGNADSNTVARVDGMRAFNRGGLLQLGAVLAVTSAPLRTSAVKRGDWILRRVLGTPTPSPPADVGSIPAEEVLADGKTVRERLEAHRTDSSCMNCHTRIDPLGFALENFDPIGQWRDSYQDGNAIDTRGILNDGTEIAGLDDLFEFLKQEDATIHRNLCRKLLGYALGRGELLSDRLLIDKMLRSLEADSRISNLVIQIVTSTQFRNQRGRGMEAAANDLKSSAETSDTEI